MRLLVILVLAACGVRPLPAEDRRVIEDFRTVDRATLVAGEATMHQLEHRLTDYWEADRRVTSAAKAWREMRARVDPHVLRDARVDRLLHQYLVERGDAWAALERSLRFGEDAALHGARFRELDEAARKTAVAFEIALDAHAIGVLPAIAPDAGVSLLQPPFRPAWWAFFLVDHQVVKLDDAGFQIVATDVDTLDVAENGVVWACGNWRAVRYDGKTSTAYATKIHTAACAAGPDGKLWMIDNDGRIASFDGVHWKITKAPLGESDQDIEQLIVTRDETVFALGNRGSLSVLDGAVWRDVPRAMPSYAVEHIFRANDGNAWIIHQTMASEHAFPDALSPLTRSGVGKPVFVDDHAQTSRLFASVDVTGIATIFDQRRNVIVQGDKTLRLPVPNARGASYRRPGGFAFDTEGRIWVDLEDGLNVITRDGSKRYVFPRGSVDAIRQPIREIYVLDAGPALWFAPPEAVTRTITGTLRHDGAPIANHDVVMCGDPTWDPPCGKGVPRWSARTDANGMFTFETVPRFRYELAVQLGPRGQKRWRHLTGACCDADRSDFEFGIAPGPIE